jgi:UDP-N-acetylmuramate dehydrogenase
MLVTEKKHIYENLQSLFGAACQTDASLARYTAARVGGQADALLVVNSVEALAQAAQQLWELELPFRVLGGGSNVLVSDNGVRGVVLLNRAREIEFDITSDPPTVWAGSGANFGSLARRAVTHSLSGLEWAAGIPGTVGGAVFGNAGAHGGDVAGNFLMAEILHQNGTRKTYSVGEMGFEYRSSRLKREKIDVVVLAARFTLVHGDPAVIQQKMDDYAEFRRRTQPPGASMGSMFKNPPNDFAGRLIEAAGLKGTRVGNAEISSLHANFFVNHGEASASDIYALISRAHKIVMQKFGIALELEIELLGDFLPLD